MSAATDINFECPELRRTHEHVKKMQLETTLLKGAKSRSEKIELRLGLDGHLIEFQQWNTILT